MADEIKPIKSESELLVERAEIAARVLKEENDRREQLIARDVLSGRSSAGQLPPAPKTEEELQKERINNALKGTGLKI